MKFLTGVAAFIGFVAVSALAGVLVTALLVPFGAVTVVAADHVITTFDNLPDTLTIEPLSQRSSIFAQGSDGKPVLMASFYDQNRREVSWANINRFVLDATVAAEDTRFYTHAGVDMKGTLRAVLRNFEGDTQGGSTITQQYVKNVLVQHCEADFTGDELQECYDAATEPSPERKVREMALAFGLERKYTKSEILTGYLNIAGFGGSVYGIETAASYYFNKTAKTLSLAEAAALLAIVNNPEAMRLDQPGDEDNGIENGYARTLERRDHILDVMLEERKVTPDQHETAITAPIEPVITRPSTGCSTAGHNAYFCDLVVKTMLNDEVFGDTAQDRTENLRRGGLNIYTTLDADLQTASVTAVRDNVPETWGGWHLGGVAVSVEVGTGRVLAMAQNTLYAQDEATLSKGAQYTPINYNTDFAHGGSSGFQPGSTYKVFTLAEWLSSGRALNDEVDSSRKSAWGLFQDSCLGAHSYDAEGWDPVNDGGESGWRYTAMQSTVGSINTGFVGMAKELDLCGIRKTAERFGVKRADGEPLGQNAASVLGTEEVAPLDMAVAYAGIANKGTSCSPVVIDRIVGPGGVPVDVPETVCTEAVTPAVAAGMAHAMSRVMSNGTATSSYYSTYPRVPMIGKTGTTDDNTDTWMAGASTKVATITGVVAVSGAVDQRTVWFNNGQAATARHRMWPAIMSVANTKFGGDPFPEATSAVLYTGHSVVPNIVGAATWEVGDRLSAAKLWMSRMGTEPSDQPEGVIVRTEPVAGEAVERYTGVRVWTSDGSLIPEVAEAPEDLFEQ